MTKNSEFIGELLEINMKLDVNHTNVQSWRDSFVELPSTGFTIDRAIRAGCKVDRLAYAFAGGYQSAISNLIPQVGSDRISSFCVTEKQGNSPKHIQTSLESWNDEWRLSGRKQFVTCANIADQLVVAASSGKDDNGRNKITMVLISRASPGVNIQEMPALSFVPELSHGIVELSNVPIRPDQVLAGDGFNDYVKPFRTVEDIHVSGATLGYLYGAARRNEWPTHLIEKILLCLITIRDLATWSPKKAETHLLLGAHQAQVDALCEELIPAWENSDHDECARWHRDRKLMEVASSIRAQRQLRARQSLGLQSD